MVLFILPIFNAVENLKVSNKVMNCVSLLQYARTMKDSEKRLNSQLRPTLARQKLKIKEQRLFQSKLNA